MNVDLSALDYDQWVRFVFDRPVAVFDVESSHFDQDPWYVRDEAQWTCESDTLIRRLTSLFDSPEPLLQSYSAQQIDQGFWFIPSAYGFMGRILDDGVAWAIRSACIDGMEHLVGEFFAKHELGTAPNTWWDSLITYCAYGDKTLATDLQALDRIVKVVAAVLKTGSPNAKAITRDGLFHLLKLWRSTRSPAVRRILEGHLDKSQIGSDVLPPTR